MASERPLTILIVEDHAINRKIAMFTLARLGYSADEAVDGAEAVEQTGARHYDLILMDLDMPVLDGLAATRQMRARDGRAPCIVAFTASTEADAGASCAEAGMNGFMSKPLDTAKLISMLKKCYARKVRARRTRAVEAGSRV